MVKIYSKFCALNDRMVKAAWRFSMVISEWDFPRLNIWLIQELNSHYRTDGIAFVSRILISKKEPIIEDCSKIINCLPG